MPNPNLVLPYGDPPEFRDGVHLLFKTAVRHRVSQNFSSHRGPVNHEVVWEVTFPQRILLLIVLIVLVQGSGAGLQ